MDKTGDPNNLRDVTCVEYLIIDDDEADLALGSAAEARIRGLLCGLLCGAAAAA